ncbi:MAG: AraC family transcriptional regulator [Clostridia bacterium]|jgi:AraC family transcriptional regulator|nr:AraC family transcriptional regulator [Clostridia bacterium]
MSVLLIQQAIEYIERHLYEKIDYTDVAKSVYMSAYNFHRTFGFLVGMSPNEYVKSRRLSLAAQALQSSEISVIDAAYRFGYETPESFSKAFSRFHGCSPVQAKRGGVKLRLFNPLAIKITFEGGSVMDYAIKRKQGQRFLAVKRAFPNEISTDDNDRSIPDFWTECQEGDVIGRMLRLRAEGKRDLYGLCRPVRANETHFDYGIGVLLDEDTHTAEAEKLLAQGYCVWETEENDYAVFRCMGENGDCIGETWSKFFQQFSPQTGYVQTDDTDYEVYFERGEEGVFCELWIPVVKQK